MQSVHYIELALNPILILELTRAQLLSPKLLDVVSKYIRQKTKGGQTYSKPAIFKQIQQYLHLLLSLQFYLPWLLSLFENLLYSGEQIQEIVPASFLQLLLVLVCLEQ